MNLVVARVGAKGRLFAQVDGLCIDWDWAMDIASSKRLIIWFEINLLSSNERFLDTTVQINYYQGTLKWTLIKFDETICKRLAISLINN